MPLAARRVNIKLTRTTGKKTYHSVSVEPLDVRLRGTGEQVIWNCQGAAFSLRFKRGTPFGNIPQGADGVDLPSGACQIATQTSYPYEITLMPTDGSLPITIDPEVIVDDSTPPPGTPKKGTEKTRKVAPRKGGGRKRTARPVKKTARRKR